MKYLILLPLLFTATYGFSQITAKSGNTITYVNTGGDNAYLIDSTAYSDGSYTIVRTAVMDSAGLLSYLGADSISTISKYQSFLRSYLKDSVNLITATNVKTADSNRWVYYLARRNQIRILVDSISAN